MSRGTLQAPAPALFGYSQPAAALPTLAAVAAATVR